MSILEKIGSAHEIEKAEQMQKEWLVKIDSQIHDLIHKERLSGVILDLTENSFDLEEPLVQCYLAKTEEEILDAHKNLMDIVKTSLTRVAMRHPF